MTNEVSTTSPQMPAYLQAALAGQPRSADSASLATAQNSMPRLSLRAKIFRFMEGQEEVHKSKDPIKTYIVGVEPGPGLFTKTWYSKPYAGSDSAGEPPDCSSADGVRPDPWINQPVNPECRSCPKNQFGSATSRKGRPAKACGDSKRLHITLGVDNPIDSKLYVSQVPVSSLEALAGYGKKLESMKVEPWMVQTQFSFVEDAEFPELLFDIVGFVDEKNMPLLKERAAKREWAQSRNLMLQARANQPAPELPAHIRAAMGMAPNTPAAPVQAPAPAPTNPGSTPPGQTPGNPLGGMAVDPVQVAQATALTEQTTAAATSAAAPSNNDILKNW